MRREDQVRDHFERFRVNESLAKELAERSFSYNDWTVVIRFYAALHLVQAFLMGKNPRFHAAKHHERERAIRTSPELMRNRRFLPAYKRLQDLSEQVRYDAGFKARPDDFRNAGTDLAEVRKMLMSKVSKFLGGPTTH